MSIYRLGDDIPRIPASCYVAPGATIIGRVTLGEHVTIWPGVVIRADNETVVIGGNTSIQDGAVLHVDPGCPLTLGVGVTIGHQAMLHGCTIGDGALIGIQAIILNKAQIGRECLVGAGAVVGEGKAFPDRSLVVGAPARVLRPLTDEALAVMRAGADTYVRHGDDYKARLQRID
jgi:carbonic anhydrase/acetyltransferase-like protein (isoleucine patch superfamily)